MPKGNTTSPSEVTVLLARVQQGDRMATAELLPLVYDEVRALAQRHLAGESAGHTLQPTALVHEAYLRLVGSAEVTWESRGHFFGAAAQAIRRILTDHARAKSRVKRGGGKHLVELTDDIAVQGIDFDVLAIDEALERLSKLDPPKARLVELKFFGGLTLNEISQAFGSTLEDVTREWRFTRVWLHRELAAFESA